MFYVIVFRAVKRTFIAKPLQRYSFACLLMLLRRNRYCFLKIGVPLTQIPISNHPERYRKGNLNIFA